MTYKVIETLKKITEQPKSCIESFQICFCNFFRLVKQPLKSSEQKDKTEVERKRQPQHFLLRHYMTDLFSSVRVTGTTAAIHQEVTVTDI